MHIVAKLDDGRWVDYEWSYGSCSVCDPWEVQCGKKSWIDEGEFWHPQFRELSPGEEVRETAAFLSAQEMYNYLSKCQAEEARWVMGDGYVYEEQTGLKFMDLLTEVKDSIK